MRRPHSDHRVLRAASESATVGRIPDVEDGAVVAGVALQRRAVDGELLDLDLATGADKAAAGRERRAVDVLVGRDAAALLQIRLEEGDVLAVRRNERVLVREVKNRQSGHVDLARGRRVGRAQIPQRDLALARRHDAAGLRDHVDVLEALLLVVDRHARERLGAGARRVKKSQLAVVVAGRDAHFPPVDRLHVVRVRPLAEARAVERVPELRGVVAGAGDDAGRVRVEGRAVDGAAVALEGADPVAGLAVAQHRLCVVARGDEPEGAVDDVGVVDVADGARVALANFDFDRVGSCARRRRRSC